MDFNEEMEFEFRKLGLGGRVVQLEEKDKGTPEDWANLERKITLHAIENDILLSKSILYAKNSLPC